LQFDIHKLLFSRQLLKCFSMVFIQAFNKRPSQKFAATCPSISLSNSISHALIVSLQSLAVSPPRPRVSSDKTCLVCVSPSVCAARSVEKDVKCGYTKVAIRRPNSEAHMHSAALRTSGTSCCWVPYGSVDLQLLDLTPDRVCSDHWRKHFLHVSLSVASFSKFHIGILVLFRIRRMWSL